MKQYGTVIAHDGKMATVAVRRHASCEKCGACGFGKLSDIVVTAKDEVGASVGDFAIIELGFGAVFKASAIVYVVPLVLMVTGFLSGPAVFRSLGLRLNPDAAAAILGFGMLAAAFACIYVYDRKIGSRLYTPRLTGIVDRRDHPDDAPSQRIGET
jgi:sigma-E factor negative regulatory protein RseC